MDTASVLATLFAAIAAIAAFAAVLQTGRYHDQDVRDRAAARAAETAEFDREMAEQNAAREAEALSRRLDQLARISALVAAVRDAAAREAGDGGSLQGPGEHGRPRAFWNARKQLELGIAIYRAQSGRELPSCTDLATGSTMSFLQAVIGGATSAFEELVREVEYALTGTPADAT